MMNKIHSIPLLGKMSFKVSLNFFKDKIFAKVLVSHRLHRFSQKFFSKNIFTTKEKKIKFVLSHPKVKNLLFLLLKFLFSNHSFVSFVVRYLRRTRKRAATHYSFIFFWSFYRKFWVDFFVRFL